MPDTIVFVCEHGAAKSVVAAAQFNRLAEERHLPYRGIARGTEPQEDIAPKRIDDAVARGNTREADRLLKQYLKATGIDQTSGGD